MWDNFGESEKPKESQTDQEFADWQVVYESNRNNTLLRMKIPRGWLYRMEGAKEMVFVPDA